MNSSGAVKSSWTPLKKGSSVNEQLFEERRGLLFKWWQKWSNEQRVIILHDLLDNSRNEQKQFAETHLKKNFPARQLDFSRVFPRHLSLYIFSFLDPRSLCRCSQVCWFWKYLTEEDALWMVKCLRFGWDLGFKPTPFETGIWKRNYIQKVEDLILNNPDPETSGEKRKASSTQQKEQEDDHSVTGGARRSGGASHFDPPPWRANDRHPSDLVRFNFLDNDDRDRSQYLFAEKRQKALQMKQESLRKSVSGINIPAGYTFTQKSPPKGTGHSPISSKGNPELTRNSIVLGPRGQSAQMKSILRNSSSSGLSTSPSKSLFSSPNPNYEQAERDGNATGQFRNSLSPVRKVNGVSEIAGDGDDPRSKLKTPVQKKVITRSIRDPPSHDLFPAKPWKLADDDDSD